MKQTRFRRALSARGISIYKLIKTMQISGGGHIYEYANGRRDLQGSTLVSIVRAMNKLRPDMPAKIDDIL